MKENIIIAMLLILMCMFGYLISITPQAIDNAVAQSFETYLELNGYLVE